MPKSILQALGWALAHTPEPIVRAFAVLLGELAYHFRRHTLLANLDHAFPERPQSDHRRLARESARRLVETGLLSLATPFLSTDRLKHIVQAGDSVTVAMARQNATPEPILLAAAHMAYWEIQTTLPLLVPQPFPEMGVIFRPVDNPGMDAWIKQTRERFGLRLLSRKEGFQESIKILRRRGMICLLFDQNAGLQGALTTLFGRVCSTSELPGLLAQKFNARVYAFYPERRGFWRITLHVDSIETDGTMPGVTFALNRWLEGKLSSSDDACASWLWAHERWKNQDIPAERLRLEAKRDLLETEIAERKWTVLPRRTRVWIRLPNWLGDVVMALPLIRALRLSRPDVEITLVAKAAFRPLLTESNLAEHLVDLPTRGPGYFLHFWRLRKKYPDCYLLFTNSPRGDLEAWFTRCRQRFGLVRPGQRRPFLTHHFPVPVGFDESQQHQLKLWTQFLNHFGLAADADLNPRAPSSTPPSRLVIGLITGSENNPEKRWPVAHWCELIEQLPAHAHLVLLGTATDRAVTNEISARCARQIENLAGRTNLVEYCRRLTECRVLVTNDTGGMHLANMLGVPLIALFGPTNPVRTRPVFSAPVTILQPPGCPPTGGGDLALLQPSQVLAALSLVLSDGSEVV